MSKGNPLSHYHALPGPVAGNGLLDRRVFLTQGMTLLGASGFAAVSAAPAHAFDPPHLAPWMQSPGAGMSGYWPYATTVFDYVRRSMPYTQSQSLTNEQVYAVTAYLLHLNGIIGPQDAMNAQTLPQVKMPNRDNFIVVYPAKSK